MDMEYKKTDTESEDSSTVSKKAVPQQFNQSELNDLVRDLDLSKQAAEIVTSRLNEKHVLHSSAKVIMLNFILVWKFINLPSQVFRKLRSNTMTILLFIIDNTVSFSITTRVPDIHIIKQTQTVYPIKTQSVQ